MKIKATKLSLPARIGLFFAGPTTGLFIRRQDEEILRLRGELNELKARMIVLSGSDSIGGIKAGLRELAGVP